ATMPCPEPSRGGYATAVQSRWRSCQSATSKDGSAQEPHCAKVCAPSQFVRFRRENKGRAAYSRARRGTSAPKGHSQREHATARRIARIATAKNGRCGCAQSYQPVNIRSTEGAQHVGRVCGSFMRG